MQVVYFYFLILYFIAIRGETDNRDKGDVDKSDAAKNELEQRNDAFWGRVYIENGVDSIQFLKGNYGNDLPTTEHHFYFLNDKLGCDEYAADEASEIKDKNAIVFVNRGKCSFAQKSRHAQNAGAAALVVISESEEITHPSGPSGVDIKIGTVMIRNSGGQKLRDISTVYPLRGRLVPIVCSSGSNACEAILPHEKEELLLVQGGYLSINGKPNKEHEFVAATFGGPIYDKEVVVVKADPFDACSPLTSVNGKAVLVSAEGCGYLEKVSNVQRADGSITIVVADDVLTTMMPSSTWEAYNITIPAIVILQNTADDLLLEGYTKIKMHKSIAKIREIWNSIGELSNLAAWPARKARREKYIKILLEKHKGFEQRIKFIKKYFIEVAGGSARMFGESTIKEDL